jgi:hypothetical protein
MEVDVASTTATERRIGAGPVVREVAVPASAREVSGLARIDYADAFVVQTCPPAWVSCDRWARAVMEDPPRAVKAKLLCGWWALGLKVGSPWAPGRVLGWEMRRNEFDCVLLAAGSRLGLSGELLFQRESQGMLFATFAHLGNPAARAVWSGIETRHRAVVRSLLRHAARRCDRMRS